MKIIIFVDFSSDEFNKDFQVSQELINLENTVLLVNNSVQLNSAYSSYDILLLGNSFSGNIEFNNLKTINIKNLNIDDLLSRLVE